LFFILQQISKDARLEGYEQGLEFVKKVAISVFQNAAWILSKNLTGFFVAFSPIRNVKIGL
jgi:hypothetical protein